MLPLYHATGVLVLPKSQKSSHVFPTPKGEKERGVAGPPRSFSPSFAAEGGKS